MSHVRDAQRTHHEHDFRRYNWFGFWGEWNQKM